MSPERIRHGETGPSPIGITCEQASELGLLPLPRESTTAQAAVFLLVVNAAILKDLLQHRRGNKRNFEQLIARCESYLAYGLRPPNIQALRSEPSMVEIRASNLRAYGVQLRAPGRVFVIFGLHAINHGEKELNQDRAITVIVEEWNKWKAHHRKHFGT